MGLGITALAYCYSVLERKREQEIERARFRASKMARE
jgi:hypothetical protein